MVRDPKEAAAITKHPLAAARRTRNAWRVDATAQSAPRRNQASASLRPHPVSAGTTRTVWAANGAWPLRSAAAVSPASPRILRAPADDGPRRSPLWDTRFGWDDDVVRCSLLLVRPR